MTTPVTTPGAEGGTPWSPIKEALELDVMKFIADNCAYDKEAGTYVILDMATLASQLITRYNIEPEDE